MKILKSARFEFYPAVRMVRYAIGTGRSWRKHDIHYETDIVYDWAERAWKQFLNETNPRKKLQNLGHALNVPTKTDDRTTLVVAIETLFFYDFDKELKQ